MAFTGSPVSTPQHTLAFTPRQLTRADGRRVNVTPFNHTHLVGAGDGIGELNLCRLPAGKITVYPSLSRIVTLVMNPVNGTAITLGSVADPCVVTLVAHGYLTGNTILIAGVVGDMGTTLLNYNATPAPGNITITKLTADTFSVANAAGDLDSSGLTYSSDGTAARTDATLSLGLRAYTSGPNGLVVAEDDDFFTATLTPGLAAIDQAWSTVEATQINSEAGVVLFAAIEVGPIDVDNTVNGWVAWSFDN